jgi:hypothetical protein
MSEFPRYLRPLSPKAERLVLPDQITERWPRLHPGAIAEPARLRRVVAWSNRQPSKHVPRVAPE